MHKTGFGLAVWILFGAMPLMAQGPPPSGVGDNVQNFEVSLGYAYLHSRTVNPTAGCCFNLHGGDISIAVNMNEWLDLVGDFGGSYARDLMDSGYTLSIFTYTFGPRISIHKSGRFTPFVQGLFGGGHAGGTLYTAGFQQGATAPSSQDSFAMALGGGLDVNVGQHFAIRAFQADWLYTQFPNGGKDRQNNLRVITGIVIRF